MSTIYILYSILFGVGLHGIIKHKNYIRAIISLGIIQTATILLYVAVGYQHNRLAPIYQKNATYVNPVPQVLMLTAIVVGVSVTAIALMLVVQINKVEESCDNENKRH